MTRKKKEKKPEPLKPTDFRTPAKTGRPSKFFLLDLEQVRKVAELGWNDRQMADFFGVHLSNWYQWQVDYPEFRETLQAWKNNAEYRLERSLYERACGYSHAEDKIFKGSDDNPIVVKTTKHYPPDTSAATFLLKNYAPERFKDRQDMSLSGDMNLTVVRKSYKDEDNSSK